MAWGIPTLGRERQALALLQESRDYLRGLEDAGTIEKASIAVLRPQSIELGGFILIEGSVAQIDALRRDADFSSWLNRVQLVAGKVGFVDAWVNDGLDEAIDLYDRALRRLDGNETG
ncbi:hypothetical protein [Mycobacterium sp. MYCO198283]|uniref:hypothetical protein n=1 Tax=Mycobacterium sp. MYCO198283 TaxID=2883505 RepID=UPI0027E0D6D8|nr:hypothetical protein [Mycobacterium sp. MYCO198283]